MTKCRAKDADQDDGLASTTNVALALVRLLAKAAARELFTNHLVLNTENQNVNYHDDTPSSKHDKKE